MEITKLLSEIGNQNLQPTHIDRQPWKKIAEYENLIKAIQADEKYAIFDNQMQYFANSGSNVSLENLADWLIETTYKNGVRTALADLAEYINNESFTTHIFLVLKWLDFDSSYVFSNDVEAVAFSKLNNKNVDFQNTIYNGGIGLGDKVRGCLCFSYEHKKIHGHKIGADTYEFDNSIIDKLEDVQLCIGLARPIHYGIEAYGWVAIPENFKPILNQGTVVNYLDQSRPSIGPPVLELELRKADEYLNKIELLSPSTRESKRIQMRRLNNFNSQSHYIDRIIDLRVCLDSVFLNDGTKDQLRHTLALRSARLLAESKADREEIFRKIKVVYDIGSQAVHTGKISSKKPSHFNNAHEAITYGALIAQKGIVATLQDNFDWSEIELG